MVNNNTFCLILVIIVVLLFSYIYLEKLSISTLLNETKNETLA